MGAQETLKVTIIGDEVLRYWADKAERAARQSTTLTSEINRARKSARAAGINLDDLPTLNRDMRLLAGSLNVPGFRQASAALFQARRGVRAGQLAREAQAIAGLDPALAKTLSTQALIGQAALAAFIVKTVYDTIQRFIKEEEARNASLEDLVREGLALNHREYEELSREQTGFASWLDQFEDGVASEGLRQTIRTTVSEMLLSLIPVQPNIYPEYVNPYAEPQQ